jgi:mannose-6-phosphate isomerase-like protein (cupin superfamily)
MNKRTTGMIRPFSECEPYTQDEPGRASFRWAVKKDEVPGLQIGLVNLQGPIHKTPAAHEDFDQVYVVYAGSGVIHLGDQHRKVDGPTIVIIPRNTVHSIELNQSERMEYAFINQHR